MQSFELTAQAPRFLPAHSKIYGHLRPRRHLMTGSGPKRLGPDYTDLAAGDLRLCSRPTLLRIGTTQLARSQAQQLSRAA
jgi:hypothetical protein